ncbi:3-hydroxyacyl-CoA dehydrogenase [Undibacterium sp. Ji67W]|uniref:3-hydroxyacyl-CoA dehydrogenase n=1 Tax=Undibacterium sp. Ji67W TaxID=3413042 RepID=UPI003BF2EE9B
MLRVIAVVGAGAMGKGIAQISAQAGFQVLLFDVNTAAAEKARADICLQWDKMQEKGKLSPHLCSAAKSKLRVVDTLSGLASSDLVIEAIIENLDAKRDLFAQLDEVVSEHCILATNTSSLSVTSIAAKTRLPQRVAGLHFFNPVPLMKVVEVIHGLRTNTAVISQLRSFVQETGHTPVLAKDTPGFIVNHAGRAYVTEALKILQENVADVSVIDQIMRSAGFKLGPFELMDLTGLDVSHPVMEAIYQQYYQEPRYRPSQIAAQRLQAGLLGRKSGEGFYTYPTAPDLSPTIPESVDARWHIPIWISRQDTEAHALLSAFFAHRNMPLDTSTLPSEDALCIVTPFGEDVSTCVVREGLDAHRTVGVDTMFASDASMTVMQNPATDAHLAQQLKRNLSEFNCIVHLIQDSVGFVAQRIIASIVNVACDMSQQAVCSPADLDLAVVLGLAYPDGPLSWGDKLGASRILLVLRNMLDSTGDPRYRPSPWLVRRVQLGLSLLQQAQEARN